MNVPTLIAGAVLIHERMSLREMTGCIVMFIAIILVQIPLKPGRKPEAETREAEPE